MPCIALHCFKLINMHWAILWRVFIFIIVVLRGEWTEENSDVICKWNDVTLRPCLTFFHNEELGIQCRFLLFPNLGLISLLWIIKLDPFTVCAVEAFCDFFESQNYLFKTMAFSRVQTIQFVLVYECLEKYPCNLENVNLNRVWKQTNKQTKHVSHNNLSPILPNQLAHFFFFIFISFFCAILA